MKLTKDLVLQAIASLKAQGQPNRTPAGRCVYINNGKRCIVGWMLKAEECRLADTFENSTISHIWRVQGVPALASLTRDEVDFLECLQALHDGITEPSKFNDTVQEMIVFTEGFFGYE
jgi:hypothetical protein